MSAANFTFLRAIALWSIMALTLGCSGRPSRVATPDVDPDEVAELAFEEYDRNSDSQLDGNELKACPALVDAMTMYDIDRNGSLTRAELVAGVRSWEERGVGGIPLSFSVRLDGRPLDGAQVKLIPLPILGDAVKPAIGITDATGAGVFNMAAEDRPSNIPKNLPVVQPGLYRVEITHSTIKVPSKFNADSTLGLEAGIAGQNPAGVAWSLSSK